MALLTRTSTKQTDDFCGQVAPFVTMLNRIAPKSKKFNTFKDFTFATMSN